MNAPFVIPIITAARKRSTCHPPSTKTGRETGSLRLPAPILHYGVCVRYLAASSFTKDHAPLLLVEPENCVSVVSPLASNDHLPRTPS